MTNVQGHARQHHKNSMPIVRWRVEHVKKRRIMITQFQVIGYERKRAGYHISLWILRINIWENFS